MIITVKYPLLERCFVKQIPGTFDDIQLVAADELTVMTEDTVVYIRYIAGSAEIADGVVRQIPVLLQVHVSRIEQAGLQTLQFITDADTIVADKVDKLISIQRISAYVAMVGVELIGYRRVGLREQLAIDVVSI